MGSIHRKGRLHGTFILDDCCSKTHIPLAVSLNARLNLLLIVQCSNVSSVFFLWYVANYFILARLSKWLIKRHSWQKQEIRES